MDKSLRPKGDETPPRVAPSPKTVSACAAEGCATIIDSSHRYCAECVCQYKDCENQATVAIAAGRYCVECSAEFRADLAAARMEPAEPKQDLIDDPNHYGGKDNPYEVHKVQVAWHGIEKMAVYFQLTAEVYLARAGKKHDVDDNPDVAHARDLRKAAWYANAAADAIEFKKYRP